MRRLAGADDGRSSAVRKQCIGHDALRFVTDLQMQGAEFKAHHQHHGLRIGLTKLGGHAQRRKGGVAAHEPDGVALDVFIEPHFADDVVVRPRIGKAGAGGEHHV